MKKTITSLLFIAMFSFTALFSQTTTQYAEADIGTLASDLEDALDGDIFELTTSGGMYVLTEYLGIYADVTIRAAANLAEKPVIKKNASLSDDYLIRLKADTCSLILQGIELQGDSVSTKYAIRTAKIADLTDWSDYDDPGYDLSVVQTYGLTINDCNINGITKGSDGRALILYPGTRGTINISNTTISEINRDAIDMYNDTDNTTANGGWQFVDTLTIENSTFYNIGREAILLRNSGESFEGNPATACVINVNHCTFDSCGSASATDSYYPIRVDVAELHISNSLFTNMESKSYVIGDNENSASMINYFAMFNVYKNDNGTIDFDDVADALSFQSTSIGDSVWLNVYNPMYTNRENGDFTLLAGSEVYYKANDGEALGDLRWYKGESKLAELTIDDLTVVGFDAAVYEYNVRLAYGTTDIPQVAGVALDENAEVVSTQASELPGYATVVVTAADGATTMTYTVNFTLAPSNDASLSNLTVNGETISGFNSAVYEYTYPLAYGTTDIPEVLGTATNTESSVVETQATELPGTATVVVTAIDDETVLTYTINFTILPDTEARLAMLTINGDSVEGFDSDVLTYDVELPKGTIEIPLTLATTISSVATFEMVTATNLPGSTLVNVTAQDEETMLTYTLNFTVIPYSDDATLSAIKVDGESIADFSASVLEYTVELDYGTTEIPVVEGMVANEFASAVNNQATELPGDATIEVTAEDGSMLTYTVSFSVAAPPTYTVTFAVVSEDSNPIEGAMVDFNGESLATDVDGYAAFMEVAMINDALYTVSKGDNYLAFEGTVSVVDQDVIVPVTLLMVGINQNSLVVGDLYPNPTNGKINFTLNNSVETARVMVTDMSGKLVINREFSSVETTLDLSRNKHGVYFVNIVSGENSYMTKVILK